jgi:hypothetical protein
MWPWYGTNQHIELVYNFFIFGINHFVIVRYVVVGLGNRVPSIYIPWYGYKQRISKHDQASQRQLQNR